MFTIPLPRPQVSSFPDMYGVVVLLEHNEVTVAQRNCTLSKSENDSRVALVLPDFRKNKLYHYIKVVVDNSHFPVGPPPFPETSPPSAAPKEEESGRVG